ncbi:serine/threonine-protein kinase [Chondromyces apiculatus]|uniref:Protein kinase domain-containing protein n=1 Tax=Chondromyces apiculatus DSM 436 TaxID=1192034 RepID=A0A017T7S4_9BACT|nr:serine/threonine-protein kinase [Chondromyces apiculatus]EYF04860.1 Hypothetical protein CAP_3886 [Chondromyces apiculatus DSM 436]
MRFTPGDTFDRYVIEESLGAGGMGEVYRALDTRLHRHVALKVLNRVLDVAPESWRGSANPVLREARAAAALNHPNAVSLFDVGEHAGAPYLAMELVDGIPLRRYIGAGIPQIVLLRWLLDVARALAAAHRVGVVHRDVKPENVMLRSDGVIKVLDFGIARRVRSAYTPPSHDTDDDVTSTLTSPGKLLGTPAYMAPEQIRGEDSDQRVDQFSWGVTAYEVLSGKLPFGHGRDMLAVVAGILGDAPPRLHEAPEPLWAILARTLEKRREDRFASMDEVVDLLEEFVLGEQNAPSSRRMSVIMGKASDLPPLADANVRRDAATLSAPPGTPSPLSQHRKSHRWPLVGAAAGALGVAVALAAGWAPSSSSEPAGTTSTSAPAASPSPASPSTTPVPITALPSPQTASTQALVAFREGLQAFRDAQWSVAHQAFARAEKLDSFFAAAHLRLAQTYRNTGSPEARMHLQRAISLRSSLSPRDEALLEAYEPLIMRDPEDRDESLRRFREASRRYPGDLELLHHLSMFVRSTDPAESLDVATRCTDLDPKYADCWQARSRALTLLGRSGEAYDAIEECIRVSPAATDCIGDRGLMHERAGRCDEFEQDTRSYLTQASTLFSRHIELATALYALGRPVAAVRAALEQHQTQVSAEYAENSRALHHLYLQALTGDLRGAVREARDLAQRSDTIAVTRRVSAQFMIALQRELGEVHQAGRDAAELLGSLEVHRRTVPRINRETTVLLLHAQREAEQISRAQYVERREAWVQGWEPRTAGEMRSMLWIQAYAMPASTPADAEEALAALPRFTPLPPARTLETEAALGKLYVLAGRSAEAIPHLTEVTRSCSALRLPVTHTVAHHHLGLAREAQGDTAGACAAYRQLLDRWPPSSGSLTSKATSTRSRALGCVP